MPRCCATPPPPSFIISKPNCNGQTVTVGEFRPRAGKSPAQFRPDPLRDETATARGTAFSKPTSVTSPVKSDNSLELFFFPRLRDQFARPTPAIAAGAALSRGLRGCVKQLAGAQRGARACEQMQDQIVGFRGDV